MSPTTVVSRDGGIQYLERRRLWILSSAPIACYDETIESGQWRISVHPNEKLARREMDLIQAGDEEAVAALYASDFVLHYPGQNPLAGTYTDVEEFLERLGQLFEGGSVERELHDALGSDQHAIQLLRVTGTAKGLTHTWQAVIVMHVENGQFTEAWFHFDDQYALDEYLGQLAAK